MAATGGEPFISRDSNGNSIPIGVLFERERLDHARDHEAERQVAKETAARLEREVEQTAQRLERAVEETAVRIEKAVQTALRAVAETAQVHAAAHSQEHASHERIHSVEKQQVDKALTASVETAQRHAETHKEQHDAHERVHGVEKQQVDKASVAMDKRLDGMNQFRDALRDQAARGVTRELFDVLDRRVNELEGKLLFAAGIATAAGALIATVIRLAIGH